MISADSRKIDNDLVDRQIADLKADLSSRGVKLKGPASVARYVGLYDAVEQPCSYSHVPSDARHVIDGIEAVGGPDAGEVYHRLVLLALVRQFDQRAADCQLPELLHDRTTEFLAKLVHRLQRPRSGRYRTDSDDFQKDLAVARLKLWPCGAELVDIASGIPRRMLLPSGLGQVVKTLAQITYRCGGLKPFFEGHFDKRISEDFSPEGYRALYLTVAEMLRHAPAIRGLFSGSWWHDPALAAISPNLAFLNDIAVSGGAKLYPMGTNDQIIAQATRLSRERTQLVQEGSYRPTGYMMVWAREDLLRWADGESTC